MKQVNIKVEKTARYFILGTPSNKITDVWFVCHGYAQLAKYFVKWFEPILDEKTLIVAPEGLHRFYWNGFSGNVAASWMTKEDRHVDIEDYVNYLDKVATEVLKELPEVNVNILGFSQGSATVSRWIALGKIRPKNFILWAGAFPDDIDYFENSKLFNTLNIYFAIGNNDEFYDEKKIHEEIQNLNNKGINFSTIRYEGGHKILPIPLLELKNQL